MADNQSSALETLADDLQGDVAQVVSELAERRVTMLSAIKAQFDAMQTNATEIVDQFSEKAEALAGEIEKLVPGFDKQASDLAAASTALDSLLTDVQSELASGLGKIDAAHQTVDNIFQAKDAEVTSDIALHKQLIVDTGTHLTARQATATQNLNGTATALGQLSAHSDTSQQATTGALQGFGSQMSGDIVGMLQKVDKSGDAGLTNLASDTDQRATEANNHEQSIAGVANSLSGDWDGLGDDYKDKIDGVLSKIDDVMHFLKQIEPLLKLAKELS